MAKLNLGVMVEVNSRNNLTYAIGTVANRANDNDINKAVVLDRTGDSAVKLAADSDEIRGFIGSVEGFTADGRSVVLTLNVHLMFVSGLQVQAWQLVT